MTELIGYSQLTHLGLGTGLDATEIANWQLVEGQTWDAFVNQFALALAAKNQELITKWGGLFSLANVNDVFLEYPDGSAVTAAEEITDLDDPDAVAGTVIGHMLPLKLYGKSVGGTWKYFQRTRQSKVQSSLATALRQLEWRFEINLLTRFFTNTETAIGSGYDVPFVRGTGGNVDYCPPAYAGETFDTAHDHFTGQDSGSKTLADTLEEMAETLEEHGHEGPFDAIVSRADVATYRALTNFVEFMPPNIAILDRAGATSGSEYRISGQPMVAGGIFGYYNTAYGQVALRATNRVPTKYAGMYKSYGQLDERNPLKVRVGEEGFGLYLVPETSDNRQWPVKRVTAVFEHGVGVGMDRTNGATGYLVAGGTWANPTIS